MKTELQGQQQTSGLTLLSVKASPIAPAMLVRFNYIGGQKTHQAVLKGKILKGD